MTQKKLLLQTTVIKFFADQSELSASECFRDEENTTFVRPISARQH